MREIIKFICTCLIIIVWGFGIYGTVQAHINHSIPMAEHYSSEEQVEIKQPPVRTPDLPDAHLVTWSDSFAVRAVVRNATEEEWRLIESISIAEAGNQDVEGVALVQLVVFNRMERDGQSARQVIFAPNQFYTVGMSGGNELSAQARELVSCGWDESQGAMYFCSTGWNQFGDEHLFKHGDHFFSR